MLKKPPLYRKLSLYCPCGGNCYYSRKITITSDGIALRYECMKGDEETDLLISYEEDMTVLSQKVLRGTE